MCIRIPLSFSSAPFQPHTQSFWFSEYRVRQSQAADLDTTLGGSLLWHTQMQLFLVRSHSRYSLLCLSLLLFFSASFLYRRRRGHAFYFRKQQGFLFPPIVFLFLITEFSNQATNVPDKTTFKPCVMLK